MYIVDVQRVLCTLAHMLQNRQLQLNAPMRDALSMAPSVFLAKYTQCDEEDARPLFFQPETERVLQDVVWNMHPAAEHDALMMMMMMMSSSSSPDSASSSAASETATNTTTLSTKTTPQLKEGVSIVFVDSEKLRKLVTNCRYTTLWIVVRDESDVSRDIKYIPYGSQYTLLFVDDLRHDILTHHEMPHVCRILNKSQIKALCAKYAIKKTQLPILRASDPVAHMLFACRGDVVYTETRGGPQGVLIDVRQVQDDVENVS